MEQKNISILIGMVIFLLIHNPLNSQVFINELMTSNSSTISDPDFDDTGDWIELYNNSNQTVDLSGFYLSDNLSDTTKWQIPANTTISPNGFLLIWADGKDTGLHTNFKLTKDGEEVGLFDTNGDLLDAIIFKNQQTDISYGRESDASLNLGFFQSPTPGASNVSTFYEGIVFYRPHFSVKGGFYNNSQEIEITAIDGQVRYTTDGSAPTINSTIYNNPITLSNTTILRASVFIPNYISGKPSTQSYFINENLEDRKLPVVSIATTPDYFWDNTIGLYVQNFKPTWEYPINIELFENDGGDRAVFNELAGTRINGLNSWELPQKMLGIYFDNEYDNNNLDYPLFFDRKRDRFDVFVLRASGSDWSNTLMRDGLTQSLTKGITELGQTGFRPSIVFVNGEYLGIHNIRSKVDEGFIEEKYGLASNEYDLIENNGEVEEGDNIAFTELFNLLNEDLSIASNYDAVASIMDIENCIDFYITELWSSNSSYGHNIQFWKPKAANSKWRWIAQDFDRSFSGEENQLMNYFTNNSPAQYEWVSEPFENLLENDSFSNAFVRRFADHLFTTFHPDRVVSFVEKFQSEISSEIPYHVARWQGATSNYGDAIPSFEYWENEVNDLKSYARIRPNVLYEDLIEHFNLSETTNLGVMSLIKNGGHIFINDLLIPENNWLGSYFKNIPFELRVEPFAGHVFEGWSEVTIDTFIPKESIWKYQDDGNNLGSDWMLNNFDDSNWESGQGKLGYGEGDENTEISYGANGNNKHITSYFRKTFTVVDAAQYADQLIVNLLRDDGAVVYLNGEEIIRSNMPTGVIDFETTALDFVGGLEEETYLSFTINVNQLLEGENVIAVEIHQSNGTSSDLSFDLELRGFNLSSGVLISTDLVLPVNLTDSKIFVPNYQVVSTCILPDTIFNDTNLTIDCSPYLAPRNVVVLPNTTLTVEAGVEVHFSKEGNLTIQGDLQVEGTEDLPVRFLPNEAIGTNTWGHLFFENTTDTSFLNWLEIKGASEGTHPVKENAAIAAWHSNLEINHLKIEDVESNPISTRYSSIRLINSQLYSKVTGDLINVKYGFGEIDNCIFKGNQQPDTDAIDYDEVKNGIIRNSKIFDFEGFNSDGIDLGEASENVLIENNFIHHITDKGVSVGQRSTIQLKNNTIVECNQGLGIKDEGFALLDQMTFYNNAYAVAAFEKNVGSGGGNVEVYNTIFSNSVFSSVLEDEFSNVAIDYTLSDTDSLDGSNFIFENPLFQNPDFNDFNLKISSSALDAGMDDFGNVIDLGTTSHIFSAAPSVVISAIHYHPLDNQEAEFLKIYNPSDSIIALDGFGFTNGITFVFPAGTNISPDESIYVVKDISIYPNLQEQTFQWTSGKLSNDGEQLILVDPNGIIIDHVTYNDQLPWATEADGEGAFLELISSDLDNHFAESWNAKMNITTNVENFKNEDQISIYPNPTKGTIFINAQNHKIENVSIFDFLGRKMLNFASNENMVELTLEAFPDGMYFIKVDGQEGRKIILLK